MRLKRALLVIGCLAIAFVAYVVWIAARAVNAMFAMEERLHAVIVTGKAVDGFILTQDPPRWPRSWDELEPIKAPGGMYEWPRDRAEIEARVVIDFDATLTEVARSEPDTFDAIRPNGPSYGDTGYIWFVVEDARKLIQERPDLEDPEGGQPLIRPRCTGPPSPQRGEGAHPSRVRLPLPLPAGERAGVRGYFFFRSFNRFSASRRIVRSTASGSRTTSDAVTRTTA